MGAHITFLVKIGLKAYLNILSAPSASKIVETANYLPDFLVGVNEHALFTSGRGMIVNSRKYTISPGTYLSLSIPCGVLA